MERREPKTPPLVMVKVPPCRSSRVSWRSRARWARRAISCLDPGERQAVGVTQHRHHQPLVGAHRHPDVVVPLQHQLLAVQLRVDRREGFQGPHHGAGEEGHEPQGDPVALLEGVPPPGAQLHHRREVDLVEGGQQRRRLLGLHQAPGDGQAPAGEALPLLGPGGRPARRAPRGRRGAAGAGGRTGRRRGGDRSRGRRCKVRRDGRGVAPDVAQHVLLHHPPPRAAAGDATGVDAVLLGQAPGHRRHVRRLLRRARRCRGCWGAGAAAGAAGAAGGPRELTPGPPAGAQQPAPAPVHRGRPGRRPPARSPPPPERSSSAPRPRPPGPRR